MQTSRRLCQAAIALVVVVVVVVKPPRGDASKLAASRETTADRPLVVVLGLPKTATNSTGTFFNCAGWRASHWMCDDYQPPRVAVNSTRPASCGACFLRWVAAMAASPVEDGSGVLRRLCGNYDAFTQIDFTGEMRADAVGTCIYPQINYLGTLLRYLPRACFVLNTRPTAHWLNSVSQWAGLRPRLLRNCPIWPRNDTGLARWYDEYKQRTSERLRAWGGCYLEVDIEREDLTAHAWTGSSR